MSDFAILNKFIMSLKRLIKFLLFAALQEKRLKGAALDVTYKEPLPETSPLWKLDNVLISPHSAPRTTTILHDALKGFLHNVKLFTEGKDLINIVDKIHGY